MRWLIRLIYGIENEMIMLNGKANTHDWKLLFVVVSTSVVVIFTQLDVHQIGHQD